MYIKSLCLFALGFLVLSCGLTCLLRQTSRYYKSKADVLISMTSTARTGGSDRPDKTTDYDLVIELCRRDSCGRYEELIYEASHYYYHDTRCPFGDFPLPKMLLLDRLGDFPELLDIARQVADGDYCEVPDAADDFYDAIYGPMPQDTLSKSFYSIL